MSASEYKVQRINIYSGDPDPKDTAPNLEVKTTLYKGRKVVPFPQWFNVPSGSVIYINCSFIKFQTISGDTYYLVWPYNTDAQIKAHWDELKNEVVIDYSKGVKNIALYCWDRLTLLKSWAPSPAVGVKPKLRIWNTSCPGDSTIIQCYSIPRLPTLDSDEPLAPKSTEMFDVCVDINALPILV